MSTEAHNRHIIYLSHGGGPLPLLGDPAHKEMVKTLKVMAKKVPKPSAILMISAHWEEAIASITASPSPELIYDYYGFPEEAYHIKYPSPGSPALAEQVHQSLNKAGIDNRLDQKRGLDHGVYVPLKIMYPNADIPCVQLSLVNSLDADLHLAIGQALQSVEWDNLLVIGSGFSFHNMRAFFSQEAEAANRENIAFEHWLTETITAQEISEDERSTRLSQWHKAPSARFCHPREEHLLPLHVCYALAGKASDDYFPTTILDKNSAMFYWQT